MIPIISYQIEILLIPKDENDGRDIIMEIRGAAGGALLSAELLTALKYITAK